MDVDVAELEDIVGMEDDSDYVPKNRGRPKGGGQAKAKAESSGNIRVKKLIVKGANGKQRQKAVNGKKVLCSLQQLSRSS